MPRHRLGLRLKARRLKAKPLAKQKGALGQGLAGMAWLGLPPRPKGWGGGKVESKALEALTRIYGKTQTHPARARTS